MNTILKELRPAFVLFAALTVICGVLYTGAVTGIAQAFFPERANGSIITITTKDGASRDIGSALIAQDFAKPEYLIGRPLGVTNLSPVGEAERALVRERIDRWHALDIDNREDIPADLVTASGSGVDPNISPAAAEYQVSRIARARGMSEERVRDMIAKQTKKRFIRLFGEPSVNVLKVNLALDGYL
jgi:K+-transporting ATPase ATPase C chain